MFTLHMADMTHGSVAKSRRWKAFPTADLSLDHHQSDSHSKSALVSRYRHDPRKFFLGSCDAAATSWAWDVEPVVCGFKKFVHSKNDGATQNAVPVCSTPVIVGGRGTIVGRFDGKISFFNTTLSQEFWSHQLDSPVYSPVVADAASERIFAATTKGNVFCIDLSGKEIWSARLRNPVYATMAIVPGLRLLIAATFNSKCFGLCLDTGRICFEYNLPKPWHSEIDSLCAHRDPYASPLVTKDNAIVFACAEQVVCLTAVGTVSWTFQHGHMLKSSPAYIEETDQIAICGVNGRLVFLDASTGKCRGEVALGSKVVSSPAISGDRIAFGTTDGHCICIDTATQEISWQCDAGGPFDHTSFTTAPDGSFVCLNCRGNIVARTSSSGYFLWETNQQLGLPENPKMDTTPMLGLDGKMYCGSYTGCMYQFSFKQRKATCD